MRSHFKNDFGLWMLFYNATHEQQQQQKKHRYDLLCLYGIRAIENQDITERDE